MKCTFQVGQKVVCVDDDFSNYGDRLGILLSRGVHFPAIGQVFTVRELDVSFQGEPFIRLVEITNPVMSFKGNGISEIAFHADRFRAVTTRKTDISCFTAILNTTKDGVPA